MERFQISRATMYSICFYVIVACCRCETNPDIDFLIWGLERSTFILTCVCSEVTNISIKQVYLGRNMESSPMEPFDEALNYRSGSNKCFCSVFFRHRKQVDIWYCKLIISDNAAVIVFQGTLRFPEVYMPIPIKAWGKVYVALRVRNFGFIKLISVERKTVVFINRDMHVNRQDSKFKIFEAEVNETSGNPLYVSEVKYEGVILQSSNTFGVITGTYPTNESTYTIESGLPMFSLRKHEYVTFCAEKGSCSVVVFSPFSRVFNITSLKHGRTNQYLDHPSHIVVVKNDSLIIQGKSHLQVQVFIERPDKRSWSMYTAIPSELFLTKYIIKLHDNTNDTAFLIVINTKGFDDIMIEGTNESLSATRLEYQVNYELLFIFCYELPENLEYEIYSVSETPFGLYFYGETSDGSFASPIALGNTGKDFNYRSSLSTTKPSKTTTTTTPWCIISNVTKGDKKDNDCDGYIDEELFNAKDDDDDGKIDEDTALDTGTGCLPGWFGTHCEKMCRCNDSACLPNGDCKQNVSCVFDFFGLQCQYKDLIHSANVSQENVRYRHLTPCHHNFTAKTPLTITFPWPTRISWIQIEAVSKDNLQGLKLRFSQTRNQSCYTGHCRHRREFYLNTNTLRIMCSAAQYVCRISIAFNAPEEERELCSIYISAGRNLALGQPVGMSSYYRDKLGIVSRRSLAVDGRLGDSWKSCSTTRLQDQDPLLRLSFLNPVLVEEIIIYFKVTVKNERFSINLLDSTDNVIYSSTGVIESIVSIIPSSQISLQTIDVFKQHSTSPLSICELEVYGECAPPMYGPDCSEICSISCNDQICTYEGYCKWCPNGTAGLYCFEGCLEWCEDYQEVTNATTTPRVTHVAYHKQSGFRVENVWLYVMIPIAIVGICSVFICTGPSRDLEKVPSEPKTYQQDFYQHYLLTKESEKTMFSETDNQTSTSVDVTDALNTLEIVTPSMTTTNA
ncbi:uncharacterized protein LOC106056019 isoform X3 [Biomphalaria glabrata]|uniref:Uncharacterized protein LOC106056019 isoform X3 n=1 Tax=Biomphalaria glabrata TaxID=6526 RepID=A0A9W2ZF64_BIOGL|nr:uncharacterized protein LOC106056019 isoform X3 [Biomphalaria glabrata]